MTEKKHKKMLNIKKKGYEIRNGEQLKTECREGNVRTFWPIVKKLIGGIEADESVPAIDS